MPTQPTFAAALDALKPPARLREHEETARLLTAPMPRRLPTERERLPREAGMPGYEPQPSAERQKLEADNEAQVRAWATARGLRLITEEELRKLKLSDFDRMAEAATAAIIDAASNAAQVIGEQVRTLENQKADPRPKSLLRDEAIRAAVRKLGGVPGQTREIHWETFRSTAERFCVGTISLSTCRRRVAKLYPDTRRRRSRRSKKVMTAKTP